MQLKQVKVDWSICIDRSVVALTTLLCVCDHHVACNYVTQMLLIQGFTLQSFCLLTPIQSSSLPLYLFICLPRS